MVVNELHGRHIPNGTVRPLLIIFSAPGLNHHLGLLYGQKPVLVQALIPNLPLRKNIRGRESLLGRQEDEKTVAF